MDRDYAFYMDEGFDNWIQETLGVSEEEVRKAVELSSRRHLSPARIAALAFEAVTGEDDELFHLNYCDECREQFEFYSEGDEQQRDALSVLHADSRDQRGRSASSDVGVNASRRGTSSQSFSPVPQVIRDLFRVEVPLLFPDGNVARSSWQFGRAVASGGQRQKEVQAALSLCCDRLFDLILATFDSDLQNIMFVCFGETMHECGVGLATRVLSLTGKSPHVVLAHDYYEPKVVCDPQEFTDSKVVVLVDVIHSGSLVQRLFRLCTQFDPASVSAVSLISQIGNGCEEVPCLSVWTLEREVRDPLARFRATASERELKCLQTFDPNRSCAMDCDSLAGPTASKSRAVSSNDFVIEAELRDCIERTNAMKMDYRISGKLYSFAVNVLDLLKKDEDSRKFVLSRANQVLADIALRASGSTCLAYHAGRASRAGYIAKLLGGNLGWPVMAMGRRNRAFALTDRQCRYFALFDNVVIVDSAIRTGDSIAALACAIGKEKVMAEPRVIGFVVFNSLSDGQLETLSSKLNIELRSAFRLPLAPPTKEIRHWAALHKKEIGELLLKQCDSAVVRDVLLDYCFPHHNSAFVRSSFDSDILLSKLNEAISRGLERRTASDEVHNACMARSPKSIRHLEVDTVINDRMAQSMLNGIMFNSMKPQMKETAAIALAAADRFDWMTGDWLKVNEPFLSSPTSAWKCVVLIEQLMANKGRLKELKVFRDSVCEYIEFRKVLEAKRQPLYTQRKLFPGLEDSEDKGPAATERLIAERLNVYKVAAEV